MLNTELIRCLSVAYDLAKDSATQIKIAEMLLQECAPAGNGLLSPAEMRELAHNKKIGAIKLYRERTGASLKDAKYAVEVFMQMMAEWRDRP